MTQKNRGAALRRAIETCIHPDEDSVGRLSDLFTDDVTVWSPNLFTTNLAELAEILALREQAFSDVDIQIDALDIFADKGFAEFRVTANFTGPFVIDEEVVIEPNGRQLMLGAAAVAEFESDKIRALRGYFDDTSLLEQMLV